MFKFDVTRIGPLPLPWKRTTSESTLETEPAAIDDSILSFPSPPAPPSTEWVSLLPSPSAEGPATRSFIGWQSASERHDITRCILDGVRSGSAMPVEIYLRYMSALTIKERSPSHRPPMDS